MAKNAIKIDLTKKCPYWGIRKAAQIWAAAFILFWRIFARSRRQSGYLYTQRPANQIRPIFSAASQRHKTENGNSKKYIFHIVYISSIVK